MTSTKKVAELNLQIEIWKERVSVLEKKVAELEGIPQTQNQTVNATPGFLTRVEQHMQRYSSLECANWIMTVAIAVLAVYYFIFVLHAQKVKEWGWALNSAFFGLAVLAVFSLYFKAYYDSFGYSTPIEARELTEREGILQSLADVAYKNFRVGEQELVRGIKFLVDGQNSNGTVKVFRDEKSKLTVVVCRGTVPGWDYWTDFELALYGRWFSRYSLPQRFKKNLTYVQQIVAYSKGEVVFTGHSLGAAEAQFMADALQKNSVGFDSPGCSNIIKAHRKKYGFCGLTSNHLHIKFDHRANMVNALAAIFTGGSFGGYWELNSPLHVKFYDIGLAVLLMLSAYLFFTIPDPESLMFFHNVDFAVHLIFVLVVVYLGLNHTLDHHGIPPDAQRQKYTKRTEMPVFTLFWFANLVGHGIVLIVRLGYIWQFFWFRLELSHFRNSFLLTATIFLVAYTLIELVPSVLCAEPTLRL